jgi:L-seryl-tRNA(Ser) seleniumtransferase
MPGLPEVVAIARARGVPVIVDAAAEYDLRGFHAAGADLVIHSAHKFLQGPTAGIVSGRADLVRAVAAHQAFGIGRPMKVGKEGVLGALAALDRWRTLDRRAMRAEDDAKLAKAARLLAQVPGIATEVEEDTTGNPIARLKITVDPAAAGLDAKALGRTLREGDPVFATRDHLARLGYILLDPRSLDDTEVGELCARIRAIVGTAGRPESRTA